MTLPYDRSGARDWARGTLRGVANTLIASYTSDLHDINETAIRHDVGLEIEHGFMGFLAAAETALTLDEYVRFVEIAVDEAKGRALVIHHASFNTLDENIEATRRAASAGAELALLAYPRASIPARRMTFTHTRSGSVTRWTSPSCSSRCRCGDSNDFTRRACRSRSWSAWSTTARTLWR